MAPIVGVIFYTYICNMNIKITTEDHLELEKLGFVEYEFGSRLHGIATEDSDYDYVRVISDVFYDNFKTLASYLPNIHSWQYDDVENNRQYVWMTSRQFWHNLFSGDGNMIADIVLLSGKWSDETALFLCKNYKCIKGFLGVAKRDLKLHGNLEKKRFHAHRSLYMAYRLLNGVKPTIQGIKQLKNQELPSKEVLENEEKTLRNKLNEMLDKNEISFYPQFKEESSLMMTMINANNLKEFKY